MTTRALLPPPLARSARGAPILHGALGASFHLEPLEPGDAPRLERACALVHDTLLRLGGSLRWVYASVLDGVRPFEPSDVELVAAYPAQLALRDESADARARRGSRALTAARYDRFGWAAHGALARNEASPWSLSFYASVDGEELERGALRAHAHLAFTLPEDTPPAEVAALAAELATTLRVRWGCCGHVFGAWPYDRYNETRDAVYAHARRYPGYDVGPIATQLPLWHDALRTVSWLTFLGPALTARLRARGGDGAMTSDELVAVAPLGDGLVVCAGERPERGDQNRRDLPAAYVRADARLRCLRPRGDAHFYAPWSGATSEAWLDRFAPGCGA